MGSIKSLQPHVVLVQLLCMLAITRFNMGLGNATMRCIESERQALLNFKKGLLDKANRLSSWTSRQEDCCRWRGVRCNNQTSHVIMLDLNPLSMDYAGDMPIGGKIGSSLLELRYLHHLDLSRNDFRRIPEFIGSLSELTYLNLSFNNISGTIPYQLGNLSRLQSLDLSSSNEMTTDNLEWLSHLTALRNLRMSRTNFTEAMNWIQSVKLHPSLSRLYLWGCQFPEVDPSSLSYINPSKSLEVLYLTDNTLHPSTLPMLLNSNMVELCLSVSQLKGPIPDSFENMGSLEHLDFSLNQIEGGIPRSLGNLCNLKTLILSQNNSSGQLPDLLQNLTGCAKNSIEILRLSSNQLNGSLPDLTKFSSLKELSLNDNHLEGPFTDTFAHLRKLAVLKLARNQLIGSLPESVGQMSSLTVVDVSSNSLNGVISEVHLSNLTKLQHMDLSFNSFALNLCSDWVPLFQLDTIKLSSCKLGPQFPSWIQKQKNFSHLDISNSQISDAIPSWFWNLPSKLLYLNLSCNSISGKVPNVPLKFDSFPAIDLHSNQFHGPIPPFLSNTTVLNLSKNMFSGSLSFLCTIMESALNYLDLFDNKLSGGLPHCWMHFKQLVILNLENNNLSRSIPSSVGSLYRTETLRLRNNSISGKLPSSLKSCSHLKLLDLGENKLTGKLPDWIGESISNLIVLRLRSNKFFGNIPSTMCHLSSIQILDLSFNNLSGTIPPCLNNLTAMARKGSSDKIISYDYIYSYSYWHGSSNSAGAVAYYFDYALVVWKGVEQEYGKTLGLLKIIDLSSNNLTGGIPGGVTSLLELLTLNLSRNNLTGTIPMEIGQLQELESLDLSGNQLSHGIPGSLADLSFLSYLDLSNNQLSGKIPVGTQLQSFDASAYLGNSELCGLPLPKKCPGDETVQEPPYTAVEESGEWFNLPWFYAGMVPGFTLGFGGVCGAFLFYSSCKRSQFPILKLVADWL